MNSRPPEHRPSPDALLRQAQREARGKLKIFLGASPGVGKTYEMLLQGAARLRAGMDVVVGVAETHGRKETEALLRPFGIVARREISCHGRTFAEMDLDAIVARRPQLVLVDDLAHSNAPGSRHPRRWQDVEELLDAGIDVYSTLNIQHVESLNDVVASFTQVRVRETVPDELLENAELEIVDLPPDELIERLKEGKVHVPEEASRALHHFFSKSNLSALRELALRRAAQAVDARMLEHLRAHALAGTFAAGERILVAVGEEPGADNLVRAGKRLADAMRAPWTALHIETPRDPHFSPEEQQRLAAALGLAASLGGTIVTIPAESVIDGLAEYMRDMRATQLVIGQSQRSWWFSLRHGSVVDRIIRRSEGVAVHVLPQPATAGRMSRAQPQDWGHMRDHGLSLLFVALVTAVAKLAEPWLGYGGIDLIYLLPVIASATLFGLRPGLVTGLASGLAYNFFFLPPLHTFTIYDPQNILTVVVLISVAAVTSHLANRVRAQALLGTQSARENAAIATFASTLGTLSDEAGTAHAVCTEVARLLDVETVLLVRQDSENRLVGAYPPENRLGGLDRAAADWAFDRGEPAGRGTDTLTASEWRFQPLKTTLGTLAVLGVARSDAGDPVPPHKAMLFMSLVDQAALAHERLRLEADMRQIASLRQRDELRQALLSSIGHDLRTPLTAVSAAAEALEATPENSDLVNTIRAETGRLGRFFNDLIDITRIEAGAVVPRTEPVDLTDAVASAVHDMRQALAGRRIDLAVPPSLPLVRTDANLLHHILINLLDNAAKFGASGTPVRIEARRTAGGLSLSVIDEGPGLPPGREEHVFDTFTRLEGSDRTGGSGLGLAIVKGFASALGLSASAANREDHEGARFTIGFPEPLLVFTEPEA